MELSASLIESDKKRGFFAIFDKIGHIMRESEDFFETARSESAPDFELLCSEIGFVLHK